AAGRRLRRRRAGLRRVLRRDRHRHRVRPAARHRVPAGVRRPVRGAVGARLLGPLEPDAVALAARLRLRAARRQLAGPPPPAPQRHGDDGGRRPLVRRRLELRPVGRRPRRLRDRRAGGGRPGRAAGADGAAADGADGPGALVRDLPPRLPRLRRLPGGHGRRRRRGAGAGAHPRPGGRGARHPARPRGPRRDRGQPLRPHRGHLRGPGPVLDPGAGRPGRRPGGGAHPHRRARPRRSAPVRTAAVLMSTTDTDAQRAPVPPGWPGDDPTLPDDLDALGARWWWWVGRRTRGRRVGALEGPGSRSSDADRTGERAAEGDGDDWPADDVAVADDELDLDDDPGGAGPRWTDRFRGRGSPPDDREPPDDDEPLPVDDDDLVAGVQPAGRVLVVLVATLVLALLVNVDDLVARVEAQPPGPARDRTLAVLHPVQDVGNALQLTRIRDALDALSGDGGDGPAATGRDGARRQDG